MSGTVTFIVYIHIDYPCGSFFYTIFYMRAKLSLPTHIRAHLREAFVNKVYTLTHQYTFSY